MADTKVEIDLDYKGAGTNVWKKYGRDFQGRDMDWIVCLRDTAPSASREWGRLREWKP